MDLSLVMIMPHRLSVQVDALCGARGEGEGESARRLKTEMMVQMTAVQASKAHELVLAATNCPYALDEAVRRRFNQVRPTLNLVQAMCNLSHGLAADHMACCTCSGAGKKAKTSPVSFNICWQSAT